jgi:mono/diheme cytochrome c family protein
MKANASMIRSIRGYLPVIAVLSAISWLAGYGGVCTASNAERETSHSAGAALASDASEHGRSLFLRSCAHCHGDDAHGNGSDEDGPDLYRLRISDARIAVVIRKGIPDEMPSFAKKHSGQDIADLTAYLRSLR